MQKRWKEMPSANRIYATVSVVAGVAMVVLAALQLLNVWEQAIDVSMPLLGVINLCQAVGEWKDRRKMAYLSLAVAVFIFICSAAVWLG